MCACVCVYVCVRVSVRACGSTQSYRSCRERMPVVCATVDRVFRPGRLAAAYSASLSLLVQVLVVLLILGAQTAVVAAASSSGAMVLNHDCNYGRDTVIVLIHLGSGAYSRLSTTTAPQVKHVCVEWISPLSDGGA
eukprot:GHVU01158545.1.p1 GENE.GHVU01158545.1~~GHVU01158545.1.p1  ORF type:complete len:136 (-),score=10.23 GHVU01158545.1:410-817(-)